MSLGKRIKKSRENKGISQAELAEMIGVKSDRVISNWEIGANKPDANKIVLLCGALNVSASYLLDYYGEEPDFSPDEIKMIKNYRALDAHGKEVVDILLEKERERCLSDDLVEKSRQIEREVEGEMRAQLLSDAK